MNSLDFSELGPADRELLAAARDAREAAYAAYSGFKVGAALRAEDGKIFTGCNIENASYGLTCCAERVAVFAAIAAGVRRFGTLAVVAGEPGAVPSTPCGACRQVLAEFAPDLRVLLAGPGASGPVLLTGLDELLPHPFTLGEPG
ncbi:MAG: cytidine deaminase [Chloroflexia bacterium]